MAATRTYLWAWPAPRPAADWLHALTRHRSPVQFPLEWSGQLLVKSDKPITATIYSYKLLAACGVELYLNAEQYASGSTQVLITAFIEAFGRSMSEWGFFNS